MVNTIHSIEKKQEIIILPEHYIKYSTCIKAASTSIISLVILLYIIFLSLYEDEL